MVKEEVVENGLIADFFHDGSGRRRPAVIMLGGSEGGKFWSRPKRLLQALDGRGYNVLSLAYFKMGGLPPSLQEIPLAYFDRAFSWLDGRAEVYSGRYALIGASKGAEVALLLGCYYQQVATVVALSPSSVVWQGIPQNRLAIKAETKSSWTYQGQALPYLATPFTYRDLPALLTLRLRAIAERALANGDAGDLAAIPAEKLAGPILLISGRKDAVWPSTTMANQVLKRLEARAFEYPIQHIAFDTGHNGLIRNRDVWRLVFDFLEENFRPHERHVDRSELQPKTVRP